MIFPLRKKNREHFYFLAELPFVCLGPVGLNSNEKKFIVYRYLTSYYRLVKNLLLKKIPCKSKKLFSGENSDTIERAR